MSNVVQFPTEYEPPEPQPEPVVIQVTVAPPQPASVAAGVLWFVVCGVVWFAVVYSLLA
ncbi:hypothetical protein [Tateyamaria sp.]|uniref:hypothetical protein n=1 Tax=Tateyamaria sp. TaxID=1929288 RepID=UPI00329CA449